MTVSAEGVENSGQLAELRRLECDAACGFLLGHPVGADEVSALVRPGADDPRPAHPGD
jgi:EAL domain-containing protein (putative c-di-GMP-specific phosphodiesterase class I)